LSFHQTGREKEVIIQHKEGKFNTPYSKYKINYGLPFKIKAVEIDNETVAFVLMKKIAC
jgi:alpha-glucosidase